MKKLILVVLFASLFLQYSNAQRFAYVNTEYILGKMPEYKQALSQLDVFSAKWQKEIKDKYQIIDQKYRDYQNEKVLLSEEMKKNREDEIVNLEKEAKKLNQKYFGVNGVLFKKREELIGPIQDNIYNAIEQMAKEQNYVIVFDVASGATILYTNKKYDKSDEILKKLGY